MSINDNPITEICIVADKSRCPPGFGVIAKTHDDPTNEADVWKDGIFAFSRIYRYICVCKSPPQNSYVCNVVADITVINDRDVVPNGYVPIELTVDTREKALRKKLICVRTVPRETTLDAISDLILLVRQKKPPPTFALAGEIDGLLLCYKFGVIPPDFPGQGAAPTTRPGVYPNLPYPIHPLSHSASSTPIRPAPAPPQNSTQDPNRNSWATDSLYGRQDSVLGAPPHSGIDGVPFELNPRLKTNSNNEISDKDMACENIERSPTPHSKPRSGLYKRPPTPNSRYLRKPRQQTSMKNSAQKTQIWNDGKRIKEDLSQTPVAVNRLSKEGGAMNVLSGLGRVKAPSTSLKDIRTGRSVEVKMNKSALLRTELNLLKLNGWGKTKSAIFGSVLLKNAKVN